MAAVLALGPRAVLSHRSAGELWGLVHRSRGMIEVTRPTNARQRGRIVAHRSALPADETAAVDGIPVTSVSRTLFDLAAVVPKRQLERALNEAEVLGLTGRLSLPDLLARYPRRRGSTVLRALLADGTAMCGVARNDFEEGFVALLDAYGLPRPQLNADLAAGGRFFSGRIGG